MGKPCNLGIHNLSMYCRSLYCLYCAVLRVTWTDAAGALTTGIHAGTTPDFAPEMRNLVWCTAAQPGVPRTATITLGAGVYYLRARSGAPDGGTGPATASVGPVVTG
jgi:hypothetical protein